MIALIKIARLSSEDEALLNKARGLSVRPRNIEEHAYLLDKRKDLGGRQGKKWALRGGVAGAGLGALASLASSRKPGVVDALAGAALGGAVGAGGGYVGGVAHGHDLAQNKLKLKVFKERQAKGKDIISPEELRESYDRNDLKRERANKEREKLRRTMLLSSAIRSVGASR